MNKIKTLKITVFVLLLINIAFVVFHFTRRMPPGRTSNIQEMVIKDLDLNESQIVAYKDLVEIHQKNMIRLEREKATAKQKLYSLIDGKEDHDQGQPQMISHLGAIQVEIEATHYEHFNRIRQLCIGDQIGKFDVFKMKLVDIFTPKRPEGGKNERPRRE
jgi:regulatory protein YycI of two-component signal transduction system YycFG